MSKDNSSGLSRRGLLGLAGAGVVGAGLGVGGALTFGAGGGSAGSGNAVASIYPFFGEHQSGIITPAQDRLHFAAFDVNNISRTELIELLQDWSYAAARMTAGDAAGDYGPANGPYDAPPDDTGEALDLPPGGLTIFLLLWLKS